MASQTRKRSRALRKTSKQKNPNTMATTYKIHWAGGTPFEVDIVDAHMTVYRTQDMNAQPIARMKVFDTAFKQLWVPTGTGPEHSAGDPRKIGNTLLAYVKSNQYIHVGDGVLRILIKEPVLGYYSELVRNDIPEPYIYTAKKVFIINDFSVYPKSILLDPSRGILSPANEGIEARKQGQGKKMDFRRINIPHPKI